MLELLSTYSISEIIIFLILLAIAVKEVIVFIDWAKERIARHLKKTNNSVQLFQKLEEKNLEQDNRINQILNVQEELQGNIALILKQIQNLINSDRDAIKAYITKEHHHFCYEAKWIDDYNLDCLEKRYQRYVEEGGNSFVGALMEELRELPRQPQPHE